MKSNALEIHEFLNIGNVVIPKKQDKNTSSIFLKCPHSRYVEVSRGNETKILS